MYALESAMDELAYALKMDPVALRRANDTMKDPVSDRVYSSRSLIQCFEQGSEAFGWKDRKPEPQSMRDGDWLVGWGCATAAYPTQITAAAVRVRLSPDGSVLVQVAAHEIGNGIYTVLGQTAANAWASRSIWSVSRSATARCRRVLSPAAPIRPQAQPRCS